MIISNEYLAKLKTMLIEHEGLRLEAYPDPLSGDEPWTIGYGHTGTNICKGMIISEHEAMDYLDSDISIAENLLNKNIGLYYKLSNARKLVLICMAFNLGMTRLLGFRNMFKSLINKNYIEAAKEILDSKAAQQLPKRYKVLAGIMETGEI